MKLTIRLYLSYCRSTSRNGRFYATVGFKQHNLMHNYGCYIFYYIMIYLFIYAWLEKYAQYTVGYCMMLSGHDVLLSSRVE